MRKDRLLSISILLVCLIFYIQTFNFAEKTKVQVVGPAVYPRFLLYIIAGLAIIILIQSFFKKSNEDQGLTFSKDLWYKYKNIYLLFLFFGVYVFLLSLVGFIVSTFLFMFMSQALLMGLKKRKPIMTNVLVTTLSTFIVYFVFTEMLNILLP